MDFSIAAILTLDGLTTGSVYALLAIALVLVFTVTRVIYVPAGELVAFGALTMAALQAGKAPATTWFALGLGVAVFIVDIARLVRGKIAPKQLAQSAAFYVALPLVLWWLGRNVQWAQQSMLLQVLFTMAVLLPTGPMVYRLAFAPVAHATVLVLLIVSMAVHFALLGLGLLMFGAEGSRTLSFTDARMQFMELTMSGQNIAVIVTSLVAMIGLALFFDKTLAGKALRATAVNRVGAQLVGIGTERAGSIAFLMATGLAVFSGILIGPTTTIYYESGFLIGLKGFVGAIIGGLAGYPLAAAGAVLVGLIESFSAFWASAYKEVIVFCLIVPVLAWRSLTHHGVEEEE